MTAIQTARRVCAALFVAFAMLVCITALAHAAPLTAQQEAFLKAQIQTTLGPFEKIKVKALDCERYPCVVFTTKPRLFPDDRSFFAITHSKHAQMPCILMVNTFEQGEILEVGEWPIGSCEMLVRAR